MQVQTIVIKFDGVLLIVGRYVVYIIRLCVEVGAGILLNGAFRCNCGKKFCGDYLSQFYLLVLSM